ncbi:LRR domain containing protein [Trema orientale]|uniref:LRR domain containing protein n=1 Tax=Trema orientale TaxID=63057 RepID=A0A2P5FS34_TREOI|nr:LRR domain containing protein [Trema orientale]
MVVSPTLLVFSRLNYASNAGLVEVPKSRCIEAERQALLKFKEELYELKEGLLSSWGNKEEKRDCCNWVGIQCANRSGRVIKLDFSPSTFGQKIQFLPLIGKLAIEAIFDDASSKVSAFWSLRADNICPSLSELQYLNYLDLSFNNFTGKSIPIIGTLSNLRYINLSSTYMSGDVPPQLANLSRLQYLDFSNNYLEMKNLDWVFHLSSLRELFPGGTDLREVNSDFRQLVNKLPYLKKLELFSCHLPYYNSLSFPVVNSSTSLVALDLSYNSLPLIAHQWLLSFKNLVYLDLSGNFYLNGSIMDTLGNITSLEYLSLSNTRLEESIPESFGEMSSLFRLDLSYNKLEVEIPKSIWNLPKDCLFSVNYNNLSGRLPESIGQLSELEMFDVSSNVLEDSIPNWFWDLSTEVLNMNLSKDNFSGRIPDPSSEFTNYPEIDMSFNHFEGPIPRFLFKVSALHLFSYRFSELNSICDCIALLSFL